MSDGEKPSGNRLREGDETAGSSPMSIPTRDDELVQETMVDREERGCDVLDQEHERNASD